MRSAISDVWLNVLALLTIKSVLLKILVNTVYLNDFSSYKWTRFIDIYIVIYCWIMYLDKILKVEKINISPKKTYA